MLSSVGEGSAKTKTKFCRDNSYPGQFELNLAVRVEGGSVGAFTLYRAISAGLGYPGPQMFSPTPVRMRKIVNGSRGLGRY